VHLAHRGCAENGPENTLYLFDIAVNDYQTDVLETDMFQTADGHIVLLHDETLATTTESTALVGELTLAEIQTLDAAYWWDPDGDASYPLRGTGIRVPSLEEAFAAFPDAYWNLEIKDAENAYEADLLAIIDQFGRRERVCWGSATDGSSARLRALAPEICLYYPTNAATCFVISVGDGLDPMVECERYDALNLPEGGITTEVVAAAKANHIPIYAWTINDQQFMIDLLDMGVDGIITDRCEVLRQVIDAR
jgi:glycerophosphoryl diester phosphodiesterase